MDFILSVAAPGVHAEDRADGRGIGRVRGEQGGVVALQSCVFLLQFGQSLPLLVQPGFRP